MIDYPWLGYSESLEGWFCQFCYLFASKEAGGLRNFVSDREWNKDEILWNVSLKTKNQKNYFSSVQNINKSMSSYDNDSNNPPIGFSHLKNEFFWFFVCKLKEDRSKFLIVVDFLLEDLPGLQKLYLCSKMKILYFTPWFRNDLIGTKKQESFFATMLKTNITRQLQ